MIYILASLTLAFLVWKVISSFQRASEGPKIPELDDTRQDVYLNTVKPSAHWRPETSPFNLAGQQNRTANGEEVSKDTLSLQRKEDDKTVWVGTVHFGGAREGDGAPSLLNLSPTNHPIQEGDKEVGANPRDVLPSKPEPGQLVTQTRAVEESFHLHLISMETRCHQEERMMLFRDEGHNIDELKSGAQAFKEGSTLREELFEHCSRTSVEKILQDGSQTSRGDLLNDPRKSPGEEPVENSKTECRKLVKEDLQEPEKLSKDFQTPDKELMDDCQATMAQVLEEGSQTSSEEPRVDGSQTTAGEMHRYVSQRAGPEPIKKESNPPRKEPPECSSPPRKKPAGGIPLFGGTELLDKIEKRRLALQNTEQNESPGAEGMFLNLEKITWSVDTDVAMDPGEPLVVEPDITSLVSEGVTKGGECRVRAYAVHLVANDPTALPEIDSTSAETTNSQESLGPQWDRVLPAHTEGEALTHLNKDRPRGPAKRRPSFNTRRT